MTTEMIGTVIVVALAGAVVALALARLRLRRRGQLLPSPDRNTSAEVDALAGELARSRAQALQTEQARRDLVASISHDLRTPLAGIRAMAEALEDGLAPDPKRYHAQIRGQVDQLTGMVDDLFELSRIHSGALTITREQVLLYDLISDTVADLAPIAVAKSLDLRFEGSRGITIFADPRQLSRVVGNLVMNAIQQSSPGSNIVVAARESPAGRTLISVQDTAGGISEDDLGRVFEAGWRASEPRTPAQEPHRSGGAGLGLAIVHGIVEAHGGEVTVQNVENGCRFEVLLPRSSP